MKYLKIVLILIMTIIIVCSSNINSFAITNATWPDNSQIHLKKSTLDGKEIKGTLIEDSTENSIDKLEKANSQVLDFLKNYCWTFVVMFFIVILWRLLFCKPSELSSNKKRKEVTTVEDNTHKVNEHHSVNNLSENGFCEQKSVEPWDIQSKIPPWEK